MSLLDDLFDFVATSLAQFSLNGKNILTQTEFKNHCLEEYITDKMCFLFQMKLNESVVAQRTGY